MGHVGVGWDGLCRGRGEWVMLGWGGMGYVRVEWVL